MEAGQCYDPLQVSESGRLLRELSFMARAEERAYQEEDGSWVVVFETWDEWTTLISINASVEDEFEFEASDKTLEYAVECDEAQHKTDSCMHFVPNLVTEIQIPVHASVHGHPRLWLFKKVIEQFECAYSEVYNGFDP